MSESLSLVQILITILLIFLTTISVIYVLIEIRVRRKLPLGPFGLPLVGYLPFLGKKPQKVIAELSTKYGNVFTLPLGIYNVVILNDLQSMKDAFNKDMLSGKPEETVFSLVRNKSFDDENGQVWREQRKFTMSTLSHLGLGKSSMEDKIIDEIKILMETIDNSNEQPINIFTLLISSTSNIFTQLVFGHRFDYNDPKKCLLDETLHKLHSQFSQIGPLSLSPIWLIKLYIKLGFIKMKSFYDKNEQKLYTYTQLFQDEISQHKTDFNENNFSNDYINSYLKERETQMKMNSNTSFTEEKLMANCKGLFGAGSGAIRVAIQWSLIFCVKYREYQNKIHEEIDCVVGRHRSPVWTDRLQMPFTQAFINEIFRSRPPSPFTPMKNSLSDSTILGHPIPKNTRILGNVWAAHNDPKLWQNPNDFNPNRFLTKDDKQLINTENLITFSIGKRYCPGDTLAKVQIFLAITLLLQKYEIINTNDVMVSTKYILSLQMDPVDPMVFRFVKRY